MKSILKPSLQQMALVKIGQALWNQENIITLISNLKYTENHKYSNSDWQEVEDKVAGNVSQLPLHEHLKKDLLRVIRPIGLKLKEWCTYRCLNRVSKVQLLKHVHWTSEGSVDRKRSSEMLLNDKALHVLHRFYLVCVNCFEDKVPEVWNQVPEVHRSWLCGVLKGRRETVHMLFEFWTYLMSDVSKLDDVIQRNIGFSCAPHVYAVYCAIEEGNVTATKFFFNKLSDEERNTYLVHYALIAAYKRCRLSQRKDVYADVFSFLHSQMSKDQRLRALLKRPLYVLTCYLDWPFQPFFLDSAERTVSSLSENDCSYLIKSITTKIADDWTDFDYRQLFRDFWNLIPPSYQGHLIR